MTRRASRPCGRISLGAALVLPGPAFAQACEKLRPGWTLQDGPLGPVQEWAAMAASLPGLILLGLFLFALFLRFRVLMALSLFLTGVMAAMLLTAPMWDGDTLAGAARAEGCLGPPWMAGLWFGVMSVFTLLRWPRHKVPPRPRAR